MDNVIQFKRARFAVGDVIRHQLFDYRGVIFDVDARCLAGDDWYDAMARSRPPKDKPWYHVLVDGGAHTTYVAERNLRLDDSGKPVQHALIDRFFDRFENGRYLATSSKTN